MFRFSDANNNSLFRPTSRGRAALDRLTSLRQFPANSQQRLSYAEVLFK